MLLIYWKDNFDVVLGWGIRSLFLSPTVGVSAAFPKQNDNLSSGPIWQGLMHFFLRCPLKLGLIQTLTSLWLLRPDFGRNADWLLEPWHKIWLAAVITGSWKHLFLLRLFSRMIRCQRWEGFCCLFLLFYGLLVAKYALICAMVIQKIQMAVQIFSGFA